VNILLNFSIVIPLFNKSKYIIKSLDSIRNQLYDKYEVIVVDDGSTDNSQEIVVQWINSLSELEKENYKIISQKNSGVSVARNTGISNAKYDYIALLDGDDYWEKNHLSQLRLLIDKFSHDVDIFSNAIKQQQDGVFIYPKLGKYDNWVGIVNYFNVSLISNGFINSSSVCLKKCAWLLAPFPVGMKNFEDVITWARIANAKGFAFNSERNVVTVIDAAEASLNIDFSNYIKHEKLMLNIRAEKINLVLYEFQFLLMHIFFAKLKMSSGQYFKKARHVFGKSYIVSICLLIGLFAPKFILNILRNARKNKR
jgi:glycosyltransferase involved in cell wall biosynthesis